MTNHATEPAVGHAEHHREVSEARLWFGVLAAPAAWIAQGALGWFFGYTVCTSMSLPSVRVVLAVISIAAIAVTVAGLFTAWRNWEQSRGPAGLEAWDRVAFMSIAGILVSCSFVAGTVWAGLTPVMLDSCGGMR
jgi:hypothetical protein